MARRTEFYRIHDKKTGSLIAAVKYNVHTERVNIPPIGSKADYLNGCRMMTMDDECYEKGWKLVQVEAWE